VVRSSSGSAATPTDLSVRQVVKAVENLLAFRKDRLSRGISLADQYNSMRDPGRNPLRDLNEALDGAVFNVYAFSDEDDLLAQLLNLNLAVANAISDSDVPARPPGPVGLRGMSDRDRLRCSLQHLTARSKFRARWSISVQPFANLSTTRTRPEP
jgi:hypothetical protein